MNPASLENTLMSTMPELVKMTTDTEEQGEKGFSCAGTNQQLYRKTMILSV
jgi:hypothetical protein